MQREVGVDLDKMLRGPEEASSGFKDKDGVGGGLGGRCGRRRR